MPMATIHPVGDHLYHIHFLDGRTDPGFGHGGGEHPGHALPGHGHVDNTLPGSPGHPANRPPGSGNPVFPDHSLPSGPPPHVPVGATLVLVRDPAGVWHYATLPPGTPPPVIDNTLPSGPPPTAGTPLPPTPAPKR